MDFNGFNRCSCLSRQPQSDLSDQSDSSDTPHKLVDLLTCFGEVD